MKKPFEYRQAPIFMNASFFPVVVFEADPAFQNRESEDSARMTVEIDNLHFEEVEKGNADVFAVYMTIKMAWPDEDVPPYKNAHIQAAAHFVLAPDLPKGVFEKYRGLSGPSMLYSSAREFIKIVTANGPWGPIMLPGMHFQETRGDEIEADPIEE